MIRAAKVTKTIADELALMWRHPVMRLGIAGSVVAGTCCVGALVVISVAALVGTGTAAWATNLDNTVDTIVLPAVGALLAILGAVWYIRFRRSVTCGACKEVEDPSKSREPGGSSHRQ